MAHALMRWALKKKAYLLTAVILLTPILVPGNSVVAPTFAQSPTRIVVLPFSAEEGTDAKDAKYAAAHYRRTIRFLNNQLLRHGFEVINPFAKELSEEEYNRVLQRAREDSPLAAREMCKKYTVEIAYMVWLKIKTVKTADGYCKATASLDGEGYDSAGRDLGAGVYKTFIVTKRDCDEAAAEAAKEVSDLVGRKLTAWSSTLKNTGAVSDTVVTTGEPREEEEVLEQRAAELENRIEIRLDGATEYTLSEIFGKIINTARGVVEARRYASQIVPDNPLACYVIWRVRIEDTDPFRLQSNVIKTVHDILDAGGEVNLKGIAYRYTAAEVDLLKGLRPGEATSRRVQFIIDRELARDLELQGRHDPYKASEKGKTIP